MPPASSGSRTRTSCSSSATPTAGSATAPTSTRRGSGAWAGSGRRCGSRARRPRCAGSRARSSRATGSGSSRMVIWCTRAIRARCGRGSNRPPGYDRSHMEPFVQGWGLTILLCAFIVLVFLAAWLHLHRELRWVRALTDHLGFELVADEPGTKKPPAGLETEAIRDEAHAIVHAKDPAWALKQVRTWQMRAQRLEPALAFWNDLLRQLGLLGTVLGIGLSLMYTGKDVTK